MDWPMGVVMPFLRSPIRVRVPLSPSLLVSCLITKESTRGADEKRRKVTRLEWKYIIT